MSSKIVHIESPQQFSSLLSSSRIVVTDCMCAEQTLTPHHLYT